MELGSGGDARRGRVVGHVVCVRYNLNDLGLFTSRNLLAVTSVGEDRGGPDVAVLFIRFYLVIALTNYVFSVYLRITLPYFLQ